MLTILSQAFVKAHNIHDDLGSEDDITEICAQHASGGQQRRPVPLSSFECCIAEGCKFTTPPPNKYEVEQARAPANENTGVRTSNVAPPVAATSDTLFNNHTESEPSDCSLDDKIAKSAATTFTMHKAINSQVSVSHMVISSEPPSGMLDPALAIPSSAPSATSLGYVAATVTPDKPLLSATSKGKHKAHVSASTANKKTHHGKVTNKFWGGCWCQFLLNAFVIFVVGAAVSTSVCMISLQNGSELCCISSYDLARKQYSSSS